MFCYSKAWTEKLNVSGTQVGRHHSEDSWNMVQDFKGWLQFSFEFLGRKRWKDGQKRITTTCLVAELGTKKLQHVAVSKWTADKKNQLTSQIQKMSGVGRVPEHHPIQTPCSGQGQLKHVATGQVLNISKDRDSIPSPWKLFSVQPVCSHSNNKKAFS